jgi:uncharacterized protein YyaL (SSP411 family)
MCLEFLLRNHARTRSPGALQMVSGTCEAMARGGMYDQLGGGFARYSVDADWVVPHFEKMLYDNALLARVYLHLWRATGSELARRVAVETLDWMLRDLRTAEGGLASALDADSEGEEGRFYVWTPEEVGPYVAQLCDVTPAGTFEHGRSVLQLRRDPDDWGQWSAARYALLQRREQGIAPARDDKVVAAWNGLAVAALAEAAVLLDRPDYLAAADEVADLLVGLHLVDGRLRRTSRAGVVGPHAGVLEDYGDVAEGLLALHQATGERRRLDVAGDLLEVVLTHFGDGSGGFFDTADDAEQLVRRPQDPTDNATPAGTSAAAGALVTYGALTTSSRHRAAGEQGLRSVSVLAERHARFAGWALAVGEALAAGPLEVAVVERPDLARVARLATSPGAVVVTGGESPLLTGRPPGAAYVCRGSVCDAPEADAARLAAVLGAVLA